MSLKTHSRSQLLDSIRVGRSNLKKKDAQLRTMAYRLQMAEKAIAWAEHDLGVTGLELDSMSLNARGHGPVLSDGFIEALRDWRRVRDTKGTHTGEADE